MRKLFHFILRKCKIYEILDNQSKILSQYKTQVEILKGLHFNSAISDSEWLKYKNLMPGEWAADYGLLYTLYRVLNEIKPNRILEFGLGQSSKIVHQYANYFNKNAITCEHDKNWIAFFNKGKGGDYKVNVQILELDSINYKGYETLTYRGIEEAFENGKFDLILVDGPFGSEHYSRPQIIDLAKSHLANSFCIIIDDTERLGEQETIKEVCKVLADEHIEYCLRTYEASKKHTLICSKDYKFLTSL